MTAILIIAAAIVLLLIGYVGYGSWLAKQWGIDPKKSTPAVEMEDGVDYVAAKPAVLMGHHFSSIAGAGPINGPIQAAVFGWVPVFLWCIIGGIFFGGLQDFGSLFASLRHNGKSVGEIIRDSMGKRAQKLFTIFALLVLILVIASFVNVVAGTFMSDGGFGVSTAPTGNQTTAMISLLFIVLAIIYGYITNRMSVGTLPATIGGIIGINVFVVLLIGIVSGAVIALATGATGQTGILAVKALLENMGSGAAGMFETSMVAILVSAICALIREYGGFEALLGWIKKAFRGKRGGQIGMGLLVGAMDIATANNTVAIVMANPIAKEMSEEYGITPRKAASILDTFSCIFQGIIPYGAQMLVAISAAHELGYAISAFDIIPNLFYPYLLAVSSFFFIAIDGKKKA